MSANIQKIDKKNEVSNTKPQFPSFFGKARLEESFNAFREISSLKSLENQPSLSSSPVFAYPVFRWQRPDSPARSLTYRFGIDRVVRNTYQKLAFCLYYLVANTLKAVNSSFLIRNKSRIELRWKHLPSQNQNPAFFANNKQASQGILYTFYHLLKSKINNNNNANKYKD